MEFEKNVKILVIFILTSVIFGGILGAAMAGESNQSLIEDATRDTYTTHSPIRINGDNNFTSANGVVGGTGTENDPYIISGWAIEDTNGLGYGIYIGNTTKYFVIESCQITDVHADNSEYAPGAAIMLYNVTNGIVYNNSLYYNFVGIRIKESQNVTIERDNLSTSYYSSVYLDHSSNNSVLSNEFHDDFINGLYISYSSNNKIYNNTFTKSGISIDGRKGTWLTQDIPANNSVNGKPVYYLINLNMDNATVPHNVGQVILGNVSWASIENLTISNTTIAIQVGYSSHVFIENNTLANNSYMGVNILGTHDGVISNNTLSNNYFSGINLGWSNYFEIYNNTFYENYYGIYTTQVWYSTINHNRLLDNIYGGIYISSSRYQTISDNYISNNGDIAGGVYLFYTSEIMVFNNTIVNNTGYGIYIDSGNDNLIYNNSLFYNHGSGDKYDSSHIQAYDDGSNNYWNNSQYGNYWHDWANNNDTNDNNHDGIVDWPYNIAGSANAVDNYPLKYATRPILPSAPQNLSAKEGDGYVNLTWEKPVSNGGCEITEYKIYRNGTLIATVSGSQLWYNDTDVVNGVTYTYHVTAINSAGESEASNEVQATPMTIPELSSFLAVLLVLALLVIVRKRK